MSPSYSCSASYAVGYIKSTSVMMETLNVCLSRIVEWAFTARSKSSNE